MSLYEHRIPLSSIFVNRLSDRANSFPEKPKGEGHPELKSQPHGACLSKGG
jgi:hypothetical protein